MQSRTRLLADTLSWVDRGTAVLDELIGSAPEAEWQQLSLLPGWTRAHVVAHLVGNAIGLSNLVSWAATGVETPMYRSPSQREADIERGGSLSPAELRERFWVSAESLGMGMGSLTDPDWEREVRTAQGRLVPAWEIPWLRAREVYVHAVDLKWGFAFGDMPSDFLEELAQEIVVKRGLDRETLPEGPLAEFVAWLTRRPHDLPDAPQLGEWL